MPSIRNIREISVKILDNVFYKGKNLKVEFENSVSDLNSRDSAFLKFTVFGVVRIKRSLDHCLADLYSGNYSNMNEINKNILRLGIYQIQFMNSVPNYAAVNSMVEIAKKKSLKFSKVVNAVLNQFIRNKRKINTKDAMYNYSHQIIEQLKSSYSLEQVKEICRWNDELPVTWLRIGESDRRKQILDSFDACNIENFGKQLDYLKVNKIDGKIQGWLKQGDLAVQSPGSGLIVKLLDIMNNEKIIDACAAPGGKAKHILDLINHSSFLIINDNNAKRYKKLKNDFKGCGAILLFKDASLDRFPLADKILVDVPCSSIGTIQKNPDIKWKKINLDKLFETQFQILQNMSKNLKNNGAIVYSTCSIVDKENFRVIKKFLDLNRNFKLDNASKYVDAKFVNKNGCISVFPPSHDMEGIFAARLIKR